MVSQMKFPWISIDINVRTVRSDRKYAHAPLRGLANSKHMPLTIDGKYDLASQYSLKFYLTTDLSFI